MRMQNFIRENRAEIDAAITHAVRHTPKEARCNCPLCGVRDHECGEVPRLNDAERENWILNDEGLCQWARSRGVPI